MNLEEKYLKARAIPEFRQEFLDGIELGKYEPYVSRVKYVRPKSWIDIILNFNRDRYMCNVAGSISQRLLGVKETKSPILVFQRAFLEIGNIHDFLGALLHHEGDHAKQRFERGRLRNKDKAYIEALAWLNQQAHIDWERCSGLYQKLVMAEVSARAKYLR